MRAVSHQFLVLFFVYVSPDETACVVPSWSEQDDKALKAER